MVRHESGGFVTDYRYNAEGIRHSQSDGIIDRTYLVDANRSYAQVLAESVNGSLDVAYHYGDDLISQNRSGNTNYFHVDGLGSTRVLTDASGNQTDRYGYAAFGEVLSQEGVRIMIICIRGSSLMKGLDQYYLRARYYDQGRGRFTRMDDWMGRGLQPITLNKYTYGDLDPIAMIDPSGNFSISVSSTLSTFSTLSRAALRAGSSAFRFGVRAIGNTVRATYSLTRTSGPLLKRELRRCRKSNGKNCNLPNVVVIGENHLEAMQHIRDAQLGRGSNGIPISPIVKYVKGNNQSRNWLKKTKECGGNVTRNTGKSCDEWPFATTKGGGKSGYDSFRVSLRLINESHNRDSGGVWGRGVKHLKASENVLIIGAGPVSFYFVNGKFGM